MCRRTADTAPKRQQVLRVWCTRAAQPKHSSSNTLILGSSAATAMDKILRRDDDAFLLDEDFFDPLLLSDGINAAILTRIEHVDMDNPTVIPWANDIPRAFEFTNDFVHLFMPYNLGWPDGTVMLPAVLVLPGPVCTGSVLDITFTQVHFSPGG